MTLIMQGRENKGCEEKSKGGQATPAGWRKVDFKHDQK